jgi:hypothetical protein
MTTQVISAIGGAVDRATIALLWLGRGVFALALLGAAVMAFSAFAEWRAATLPSGHIYENQVLPALGFLFGGTVVLGLTRVMRWILTGK